MSEIEPGSRVMVHTADGELLPRRAATGIEDGSTFKVVWVCKEDEWTAATSAGREADVMPWPAEYVELAEEVPA